MSRLGDLSMILRTSQASGKSFIYNSLLPHGIWQPICFGLVRRHFRCLHWENPVDPAPVETLELERVASRIAVSLAIRKLEWESESARFVEFLRAHLSPSITSERCDWLYEYCPEGKAAVWVLAEQETGRIVGAAASFPRKMRFMGQITAGCVFGDFCVAPEYRTLGPALSLQRKLIESAKAAPFSIAYDLPSTSMLAIYKRLGIVTSTRLVRMCRTLRLDRKIQAKITTKALARGVSSVVNAALSLRSIRKSRPGESTIESISGRFGPEYTELAERTADSEILVHRTAEFLNWRYLDHPERRFEGLEARRGRTLSGYVMYMKEAEGLTIAECLGETRGVRMELISAVVDLAGRLKAQAVNAPVNPLHRFADELSELGFQARESCPAIFIRSGPPTTECSRWMLFDGDRES
jgi:hypothetical protein